MIYKKKEPCPANDKFLTKFFLQGLNPMFRRDKMQKKEKCFYCFEYIKANREAEELCFETKEKAEEIRRMYISMGAIVSEKIYCRRKV